jgi:hypothetical protein
MGSLRGQSGNFIVQGRGVFDSAATDSDLGSRVEAMGLEPTNLLTASQALYQLSYAPG